VKDEKQDKRKLCIAATVSVLTKNGPQNENVQFHNQLLLFDFGARPGIADILSRHLGLWPKDGFKGVNMRR